MSAFSRSICSAILFFQQLGGFVRKFFFFRPPSLTLETRNWKLEIRNWKCGTSQSAIGNRKSAIYTPSPAGRPAGRRQASFLLRPWGKARGGAAAERVRGGQEPREPTRLRHSEQKTHLHPVRLAIFMPLSYGLPTKR